MEDKSYRVIGLMSGTSRDGIDLACVDFRNDGRGWCYDFIAVDTLSYSSYWERILADAHQLSIPEATDLDKKYTAYLAKRILFFIADKKLRNIDAVCSHGHTVFHLPEKGVTLQIGNRPELAALLHLKVVCDFRTQDVRLGGQGAPLVPVGDKLLFSDYKACINLGGFANISFDKNGERLAYDICPVNTVLNNQAQKCGKAFDEGGNIAESGTVDGKLLERLNGLPFYKMSCPKSLGIEWVKREVAPLLEAGNDAPQTVLATFTAHIAAQLSAALSPFGKAKVLVTGGGAYNDFLLESLKTLTEAQLQVPEKKLIDYKEALIFGLLGILRLRNEPNVLKSVTGATKDHSSGFIFLPTSS